MKRILFIAPHRLDRSPGQRFRFEQYLGFLESEGFSCRLSPLLSPQDDARFYRAGGLFSKALILVKAFAIRLRDLAAARDYDVVFIYREAFFTGTLFFEKAWKFLRKKIVFDFDDAIWLLDVSDANKKFSWLKSPGKTAEIIKLSTVVITGNEYLADYARRFNANVMVIPTTVDTDRHSRRRSKAAPSICIGWSGSKTTIKHFNFALPVLRRLSEKYGDKITFKVIGDADYSNAELSVVGTAWTAESEVEELSSIDIGIMPLPDDEWAKGKCGLKGLTYMSLGIPTIMSPVGVNATIIRDGENGFLARNEREWLEKLSALVESAELRERLGAAGRQTVVDKYSVSSQRGRYLNVVKSL